MNIKIALTGAAFLLAAGLSAQAQDNEYAVIMKAYLSDEVTQWVADDVLVAAVKAQNERTAGLSPAEIDALDKQWRAEVDAAERPLVDAVMSHPASAFLVSQVAAAGGAITEIIVMDRQGLNVAVSAVTSDYWQGDEEKHSETFGRGPGVIHVGEMEVDGSTGLYQAQISMTLVDPADNSPIGAITVGLMADALL